MTTTNRAPWKCQGLSQVGSISLATSETQRLFADNGVPTEMILKMYEGCPNIADAIKNGCHKDIRLISDRGVRVKKSGVRILRLGDTGELCSSERDSLQISLRL